jgi:hypothetical protein
MRLNLLRSSDLIRNFDYLRKVRAIVVDISWDLHLIHSDFYVVDSHQYSEYKEGSIDEVASKFESLVIERIPVDEALLLEMKYFQGERTAACFLSDLTNMLKDLRRKGELSNLDKSARRSHSHSSNATYSHRCLDWLKQWLLVDDYSERVTNSSQLSIVPSERVIKSWARTEQQQLESKHEV